MLLLTDRHNALFSLERIRRLGRYALLAMQRVYGFHSCHGQISWRVCLD